MSSVGGGLEFVYTKTYFLKLAMCNLYTTEIHKHSFSPPTVNTRVQIVQQITIDYLWFTPCSVLWTSRRSLESTDRILMATINDYIVYNHRSPKYSFSTLKDIQLLSTSSHCCAQLVSFWLRAMDSPWETNCTQHDSTDRYAIGNRKWVLQCTQ